MQAATHSVLSTASNTPSKSTSLSKATYSQVTDSQGKMTQGGGFAEDFQRAKHALDSDVNTKVGKANAATPKTSQESVVGKAEGQVPQNGEMLSSGNERAEGKLSTMSSDSDAPLPNELKAGVSQVKTAEISGNALQSVGEKSPDGEALTAKLASVNSQNTDQGALKVAPSQAGESSSQHTRTSSQTAELSNNRLNSHQVNKDHLVGASSTQETSALSTNERLSAKGSLLDQSAVTTPLSDGEQATSVQAAEGRRVTVSTAKTGQSSVSETDGVAANLSATNVNGLNAKSSNSSSEDAATLLVDDSGQPEKVGVDGEPLKVQAVGRDSDFVAETPAAQTKQSDTDSSTLAHTGTISAQGKGSVAEKGQIETDADGQVITSGSKALDQRSSKVVDQAALLARGVGGTTQSADTMTAKEAERVSKVPPEVLALERETQKAKASTVDLSALSPAAQKLALSPEQKTTSNQVVHNAAKSADDALEKHSETTPSGDLAWVLSQMSSNPVAQASGATTIASSAASKSDKSAVLSVGDKGATTKIADQVALANALKGATGAPSETPLILSSAGIASGATEELAHHAIKKEGLMPNEPIEFRKKEQDALISKMTAQFDGVGKDNDSGGMGSSLSTQSNGRLGTVSTPLAAQNMNAPNPNIQQNLAMSVPPNHPGWAGEMSQKVAWLAQGGAHSAHIKLDPPELGSLTVKVSVDNDNNSTQVSFVAATPHTRDLLEGQMGRLRDMLAQQGMDLGSVNVDVSQQDTSGMQYKPGDQGESGVNFGRLASKEDAEEELPSGNISYVTPAGIDYYA